MFSAADRCQLRETADPYVLDIGAGSGMFTQEFHKAGLTRLAAHEIPGSKLGHLEAIGCKVY